MKCDRLTTIINKSVTGDKQKDKYAPKSMREKQLMTASDIEHLDITQSLIIFSRSNPSIVKFTPSWKMKDKLNLNDDIFRKLDPKPVDFLKNYWVDLTEISFNKSSIQNMEDRKNSRFKRFEENREIPNVDHLNEANIKEIAELDSEGILTENLVAEKNELLEQINSRIKEIKANGINSEEVQNELIQLLEAKKLITSDMKKDIN